MADSEDTRVLDCTRCPALEDCRSQIVNGTGDESADLMFVGEAPGEQEDTEGKPFVGRSGQVLMDQLAVHGLARADVRITNCVRCRPPENRDPTDEELSNCRGFLEAEIEAVNPDVIVTLGKVPSEHLLERSVPVTEMAGSVIEKNIGSGVREVVVSVHPAATLYDSSQKDSFADAIETAVDRSDASSSQSTIDDF